MRAAPSPASASASDLNDADGPTTAPLTPLLAPPCVTLRVPLFVLFVVRGLPIACERLASARTTALLSMLLVLLPWL